MANNLYSILLERFVEIDPVRGIDKSDVLFRNYVVVADTEEEGIRKSLKDSNKGFSRWELSSSEILKSGDKLPSCNQLIFL